MRVFVRSGRLYFSFIAGVSFSFPLFSVSTHFLLSASSLAGLSLFLCLMAVDAVTVYWERETFCCVEWECCCPRGRPWARCRREFSLLELMHAQALAAGEPARRKRPEASEAHPRPGPGRAPRPVALAAPVPGHAACLSVCPPTPPPSPLAPTLLPLPACVSFLLLRHFFFFVALRRHEGRTKLAFSIPNVSCSPLEASSL